MRFFTLVLAGALLIATQTAQGASLFVGSYDLSLWNINLNGGCGVVDISGAPNSVVLTSNDCGGDDLGTDFTIAATQTGSWSFDWLFQNNDVDDCCEEGGYLLNGVFTVLGTTGTSSGSVGPIAVTIGDIIGFRANATDGCCGPGFLTITNFSAPEVPEPSSLTITGLGSAILVFLKRRRRSCAATGR